MQNIQVKMSSSAVDPTSDILFVRDCCVLGN